MTTPEGCRQPVQEEPTEVPLLTGTRSILSSTVPTGSVVDGGIHTVVPLISPSPVREQVPVRTINNDDDTSQSKEETKGSESVLSYLSFISNPSLRKMLDRTSRELFKDFDTWLEEFDTPRKKPDLESMNTVVVKFLEEEVTRCQIDMDMIVTFRDSGITSYEDYLIFMNRNIPEVVSALGTTFCARYMEPLVNLWLFGRFMSSYQEDVRLTNSKGAFSQRKFERLRLQQPWKHHMLLYRETRVKEWKQVVHTLQTELFNNFVRTATPLSKQIHDYKVRASSLHKGGIDDGEISAASICNSTSSNRNPRTEDNARDSDHFFTQRNDVLVKSQGGFAAHQLQRESHANAIIPYVDVPGATSPNRRLQAGMGPVRG